MKHIVSKQAVIEKEVPQSTDSYQAVPNKTVINTLSKKLHNNGYQIYDEFYKADRNLNSVFGNLFIKGGNTEMGYNLSWVNSYNKSRRFSIATGINVYLCDNLDFAEHKFMRKHTANFWNDFDSLLDESIQKIEESFREIEHNYNRMKSYPLQDNQIGKLVGELFYNESLLTTEQLNRLKDNLVNRNLFGRDNYFDFFMHLTDSLKLSHPTQIIENHRSAHDFVMSKLE